MEIAFSKALREAEWNEIANENTLLFGKHCIWTVYDIWEQCYVTFEFRSEVAAGVNSATRRTWNTPDSAHFLFTIEIFFVRYFVVEIKKIEWIRFQNYQHFRINKAKFLWILHRAAISSCKWTAQYASLENCRWNSNKFDCWVVF